MKEIFEDININFEVFIFNIDLEIYTPNTIIPEFDQIGEENIKMIT